MKSVTALRGLKNRPTPRLRHLRLPNQIGQIGPHPRGNPGPGILVQFAIPHDGIHDLGRRQGLAIGLAECSQDQAAQFALAEQAHSLGVFDALGGDRRRRAGGVQQLQGGVNMRQRDLARPQLAPEQDDLGGERGPPVPEW